MPFEINFHTDVDKEVDILKTYASKRIKSLRRKFKSLETATVNLITELKGSTPHLFKCSVVIHSEPKKFISLKKGEIAYLALKESLDSIESQIVKTFDKISHPWEKK